MLRLRALMMVAIVLAVVFQAPVVARADGAQFLEKSALVIPVDTLQPGATWTVAVINPSAQPLQVSLKVGDQLTGYLKVVDPDPRTVLAGQTTTFTLAPGPKSPRAATGDLVVIAGAAVDRRQVQITGESLVKKYFGLVAGALVLIAAVVIGVAVLTRRGRAGRKSTPSRWLQPQTPTEPSESATLHRDEPTEFDTLDRRQYAEALAQMALDSVPPLVIGVFGEWGSGKTSLLLQIKRELQSTDECALAWFEPWKFQNDPDPVLPLLHAIVRDLGLESSGDVRRSLSVISETLGSIVLSTAARVSVADLRRSIGDYDKANYRIRSEHTQLDEHFRTLISQGLAASGKKRLVVFIDDLDRCIPEQILALLEALKLYLNRDECVFFLAVDSDRLAKAVAKKYEETGVEGRDYLDKIVQVPFAVPRIALPVFTDYVESLLTPETLAAEPVLLAGLHRNPRSARRLVNILVLQDALAQKRKVVPYHVAVLAAVLLCRWADADFYSKLEADSTLLRRVSEDLNTADERGTQWPDVVVRCVSALMSISGAEFDDVGAYIDLASAAAPEPQPASSVADVYSSSLSSSAWEPADARSNEAHVPIFSLGEARHDLRQAIAGSLQLALPAPDALIDLDVKLRQDLAETHYQSVLRATDPVVPAREIHEVFDRSQRQLMIIGPPGSGKTVLLLQIAESLLKRAEQVPSAPIPVPLFIREWDQSRDSLTAWAASQMTRFGISRSAASTLIDDRAVALLLDGLDEVPERGRLRRVAASIQSFVSERPDAALAVTCRSSESDYLALQLRGVVEVLPVNKAKATEFMQRQTGHAWGPDELGDNLSDTPLGLSLLARWFHEVGELPPSRASSLDIVQVLVERLIRKISARVDAPDHLVVRIFTSIALRMATNGSSTFDTNDVSVRDICRDEGLVGSQVDELVNSAVNSGLLASRGGSRYAFAHHIFNDYFTGRLDVPDNPSP